MNITIDAKVTITDQDIDVLIALIDFSRGGPHGLNDKYLDLLRAKLVALNGGLGDG